MSLEVQHYVGVDQRFDAKFIERIILDLGDAFEIRIAWNRDTALLTGVCAVAGGLVGNYAGGRLGAVLGASIGGAAGLGVSMVSLRDIWDKVKDQLKELMYIVFNFLRRLDIKDYARAIDIIMTCGRSRRELVFSIVDFVSEKLAQQVISNLSIAHTN